MVPNDNGDIQETTLSPEVRRIRNSIIKKFAHEPLDIMAKFVKDVVENEQDTVKRLGAMAARVEILRMRISQISNNENEVSFNNITEEEVEEHKLEAESSEIVITSPNLSDWVRLRIIENSEINGVRFPKGVVIDVSQEDGDRLLESGKASYVDEDEIADVKSDLNLQKNNDRKLSDDLEEKVAKVDRVEQVDTDKEEEAGTNQEDREKFEPHDENEPSLEKSENAGVEAISDSTASTGNAKTKKVASKKTKGNSSNTDKSDEELDELKDIKTGPEIEDATSEGEETKEDLLAGFELEDEDTKK